ncbi:hypothetical protein A9C19_08870 [Bacillus weihaiensis]|uniref:Uncharacterized protein n=1 Tax=Bacillus weihaiensis TaxID=1547283 RepID=A0A1L3MR76_9BACI|nr:hypothetical protein A9C19_08870 [Bacillus weihaiensis]
MVLLMMSLQHLFKSQQPDLIRIHSKVFIITRAFTGTEQARERYEESKNTYTKRKYLLGGFE